MVRSTVFDVYLSTDDQCLSQMPRTNWPACQQAGVFIVLSSQGHIAQVHVTSHLKVRKLFEGGNYSRAETI